jgi:hypothetical protein
MLDKIKTVCHTVAMTIAVDIFIRNNKNGYTDCNERNSAITEKISWFDFENYYGLEYGDYTELSQNHYDVYELNRKYPDKIVILKECEHKGKKQKHHPDYDKPFEIEILCKKCHFLKHKDRALEVFNRNDFDRKRM